MSFLCPSGTFIKARLLAIEVFEITLKGNRNSYVSKLNKILEKKPVQSSTPDSVIPFSAFCYITLRLVYALIGTLPTHVSWIISVFTVRYDEIYRWGRYFNQPKYYEKVSMFYLLYFAYKLKNSMIDLRERDRGTNTLLLAV